MSVSLWQRNSQTAQISADVVVIGGGFAGLCCALALQDAGADALVIERHTIGWGASGRNAGYMMRGAADNYAAAVESYGRDRAKELWQLTERNLEGMLGKGAGEKSRACPSCLLAMSEEEHAQLCLAYKLLIEDGFEARWLDTHDDDAWRTGTALGGLVNPNDRVCDPTEIAALLRGQLAHPPLEGGEVFSIDCLGEGVSVRTSAGEIQCGRAIVCTNAYLNRLLPQSSGAVVQPNRAQMLAINADGRRFDYAYYANHGGEYFRQHDDNTLLFGGKRLSHDQEELTDDDATSPGVQGEIESFAGEVLGGRVDVTARWAGIMGFTKDHLPLAGPLPGGSDRIWVCAGFNGHGASMAHETARRTVESMTTASPPPFPLDRPGLG